MTALFRYLFLTVVLTFASPAGALPTLPTTDYLPGGQVGMHLFLPSEFLTTLCQDRLQLARIRYYKAAYDSAVERRDYSRGLEYADSLIRISKSHSIPGVHFTRCYQNRAQMLEALHRYSEACMAYARAVRIKDLAMSFRQDQDLREMQASYELDRLALDKALLTARHHKLAVIASALLLCAIAFVVAFIYDANRRTKRLQRERLLQRKDALRSEEKKTAFINSICHEVRTPLNSIAGFSELLCEESVRTEAHGQYCKFIQNSRRELRYLFDDILEVAYLENLHEPLSLGNFDLGPVCYSQLGIMKIRFPLPDVAYAAQIPATQIVIESNEKYLGILVAALLGNAHKFTQQGTICLACRSEGDEHVVISVTDTGCGIPQAQHDYVFERFTKLDPFSQGNGLGLYLCRLIVRHLGGTIYIDEGWSAGTRVVVTLPRHPRRSGKKRDTTGGHTPQKA